MSSPAPTELAPKRPRTHAQELRDPAQAEPPPPFGECSIHVHVEAGAPPFRSRDRRSASAGSEPAAKTSPRTPFGAPLG